MSAAAPAMQQAYINRAEDRLLKHLDRVAAKTHAEGNLEQSQELYESLLNARRERHGDTHPLTVSTISTLSAVVKDLGELDTAEGLAREANTASTGARRHSKRRRVTRPTHRSLPASADTLGAAHPTSLRSLALLADVLTRKGELDEAESTWHQAVEGFRNTFGDGHDELENAENNLGALRALRQACG